MSLDAAIARFAERGREAKAKRESARERNRREMPESAALFDAFTAAFGPLYRFRMAENGKTVDYVNEKVKPKERIHPPLIPVSLLVDGMKSGAIQPSGQVRERRRKPVWEGEE